jgi:hypothetical protein
VFCVHKTPNFSLMNTSSGIEPIGFILRFSNVLYFRQRVVGRRRLYRPPLPTTQLCGYFLVSNSL